MLDLFVNSRFARDLSGRQFVAAPRAAEPETVAPRAPVRRGAVRVLRGLADRLEPARHPAPQS